MSCEILQDFLLVVAVGEVCFNPDGGNRLLNMINPADQAAVGTEMTIQEVEEIVVYDYHDDQHDQVDEVAGCAIGFRQRRSVVGQGIGYFEGSQQQHHHGKEEVLFLIRIILSHLRGCFKQKDGGIEKPTDAKGDV